MISIVNSVAINGLHAYPVDVEVDLNNGLPSFVIVGLPDQWVQESKERLKSALKSSGNKLPMVRITVNLAPANIRKSWPSFDFPIAIGILLNGGYVADTFIEGSVFLWELSLDGKLRSVSSVLPATIWAQEEGLKRIFVPVENAKEAAIIPGIDVIPVESLKDAIDMLNGDITIPVHPSISFSDMEDGERMESQVDFKYILGQNHAKRALEISASGGHNVIMDGPPWSGKTMLSKAFASILPDLSIEEAIEVSKIYSVSGLLNPKKPILKKRPFRTIHHTASSVSIIGGGRNAKPWEISLAHKWVLFLDEILEFEKSVLEVLRQPLEDGDITVNRIQASYTYPAKFTLIAAMNPCPCGFFTDPEKECICSTRQVENYRAKLSGPLIDRVDMFIDVPKVKTNELQAKDDYTGVEDSGVIKQRVEKARAKQRERFHKCSMSCNAEMGTKEINMFCKLEEESNAILAQAVQSLQLSARAYYRVLKLARTIADLAESETIEKTHILEALSFRKQGA